MRGWTCIHWCAQLIGHSHMSVQWKSRRTPGAARRLRSSEFQWSARMIIGEATWPMCPIRAGHLDQHHRRGMLVWRRIPHCRGYFHVRGSRLGEQARSRSGIRHLYYPVDLQLSQRFLVHGFVVIFTRASRLRLTFSGILKTIAPRRKYE